MGSKDKEQPAESQQAEQPAQAMDTTVPGGRYLVNGQMVNANGEPLSDPAPDASLAPSQNGG